MGRSCSLIVVQGNGWTPCESVSTQYIHSGSLESGYKMKSIVSPAVRVSPMKGAFHPACG